MAKEKFNPNLFKAAQEKSKEFGDIPHGTYVCELDKAYADFSKNNEKRYQALFAWKINEDDENCAGQLIWQTIGLTDSEGEQSEKGYEILSIILNQLKFAGEINNDEELQAALESRVGTQARIKKDVNKKDTDYDTIRIVRIISLPGENGESIRTERQTTTPKTPTSEVDPNEIDKNDGPTTPQAPEKEPIPEGAVELKQGMKLRLKNGKLVEIIALLEAHQAPSGENSLMVFDDGKARKDGYMIKLDEVKAVEGLTPEVDEVDEDDTPTALESLKEGDKVKGINLKGVEITGTLKTIENGVAKVSVVQKTGPNILTKCDVTKLVKV